MANACSEKGFHSWIIGEKGEALARSLLRRLGFEVVKSIGTIDEYSFTILANPRKGRHTIAGIFAFDLYAEKGTEKWFIEVKATEQKREHGVRLTNRQCRFGFALQSLGYNVGILRIRLKDKEATLHKIPRKFFRGLFISPMKNVYYYPTKKGRKKIYSPASGQITPKSS